MCNRIDNLVKSLPNEIDAAIVLSPSNKSYLLSYSCDEAGTLIITRGGVYYIIDSRYIEVAQNKSPDFVKVYLQEKLIFQIEDIFIREKIKTFSLENNYVNVDTFKNLKTKLSNFNLSSEFDVSDALSELRAVKSSDEIEKIKKAQKITELAYNYIFKKIRVGKSERELALELEFFMRSNGADKASFDIIFIAGKNTSMPHGVPSNYKIHNGDLITMDFGADYEGYKSDMTRTVAVGSVTDEQRSVYEIVLEAQNTALSKICAGKKCSDIDAAARAVISDSGYGDFFGHALGHSVGLDIHENPNFSPKCNKMLKSNMVLTVEPGIYLPQKFGVRIEDMVVVTQNGIENLTNCNKTLNIL